MTIQSANQEQIAEMTRAAIDVIRPPGRATLISADHPLPEIARSATADAPELELFHFGFSICSQKVRTVLSELNVGFGSNQFAGPIEYENYTPAYVRLRLQSDVAKSAKLVSSYSGGSAVESEGFDPLVVPTLVDNRHGRVIADSKLICLYLARNFREHIDLLPRDIEPAIIEQIDRVDRTPHVAMLYGANPDCDTRPPELQARMPGIHQKKFRVIEAYIDQVRDEPDLVAAYRAKLEKEKAAETFVVDDAAMRSATAQAETLIRGLEDKLAETSGPWIFGERFTLADVVWGVSLIRLDYLGNAEFWGNAAGRPRVKSYFERALNRPSLVTGVLEWPGSGRRLPTT